MKRLMISKVDCNHSKNDDLHIYENGFLLSLKLLQRIRKFFGVKEISCFRREMRNERLCDDDVTNFGCRVSVWNRDPLVHRVRIDYNRSLSAVTDNVITLRLRNHFVIARQWKEGIVRYRRWLWRLKLLRRREGWDHDNIWCQVSKNSVIGHHLRRQQTKRTCLTTRYHVRKLSSWACQSRGFWRDQFSSTRQWDCFFFHHLVFSKSRVYDNDISQWKSDVRWTENEIRVVKTRVRILKRQLEERFDKVKWRIREKRKLRVAHRIIDHFTSIVGNGTRSGNDHSWNLNAWKMRFKEMFDGIISSLSSTRRFISVVLSSMTSVQADDTTSTDEDTSKEKRHHLIRHKVQIRRHDGHRIVIISYTFFFRCSWSVHRIGCPTKDREQWRGEFVVLRLGTSENRLEKTTHDDRSSWERVYHKNSSHAHHSVRNHKFRHDRCCCRVIANGRTSVSSSDVISISLKSQCTFGMLFYVKIRTQMWFLKLFDEIFQTRMKRLRCWITGELILKGGTAVRNSEGNMRSSWCVVAIFVKPCVRVCRTVVLWCCAFV